VLWASALGRLRRLESLRSKLDDAGASLRNALAESPGDKGRIATYKHRSPGRRLIGPLKLSESLNSPGESMGANTITTPSPSHSPSLLRKNPIFSQCLLSLMNRLISRGMAKKESVSK
jgi:hypothetical protein